MTKNLFKAFSIMLIFTLVFPIAVSGANSTTSIHIPEKLAVTLTGAPPEIDKSKLTPVDTKPKIMGEVSSQLGKSEVYFVILEEPAVPSYTGGISGFQPTSPISTGDSRLDIDDSQVVAYADYLQSRQNDTLNQIQGTLGRQIEVSYQYRYALNGLAIEMAPEEAAIVTRLPGVLKVESDQANPPITDVSPTWIGATSVWDGSATGGPGTKGEGITIGMIDTGINMDHPSFAALGEDGYLHSNPNGTGNYLGWCDDTNPNYNPSYDCNDKLIGAWDYADASWGEDDGPNDSDGHGSHTASTAAGNYIAESVLYGPTTSFTDSISGIAPHANLIAYDVCEYSCYDTDVVAAVEQAILDGVDVINESIGIGGDTFNGSKQTAYLNAVSAGIFYARAAGNEGPAAGSVGPEPPWTLSTAALTHNRKIFNNLVNMTGGDSPPLDMIGEGFTAGYGPAPIVYAGDYTETLKPGANAENARLCGMGNPDDMVFDTPWEAGTFNGEIVVCDRGVYPRVEKGANVLESGAGGFVLVDDGNGIVSDAHYLPGLHISQADGIILKDWLDPSVLQTATITGFSVDYSASNGDVMAGFSSRGPGSQDFIKPDIGAPGVSIWAAYADNPGGPDEGQEFSLLGGTSMASPQIAGSAALIKAAHPAWTPAEIKSALMSTATHANTVKEDGSTSTEPFDIGSGRVQVDQAAKAGLLFDISPAAYSAANKANASALNLPSFADDDCFRDCSWTRTVSNDLDHTETWYTALDSPEGVLLQVDPISFTLTIGASQAFTLTATLSDTLQDVWLFGSLTLSPEGAEVPDTYLPLALYASSRENLSVLGKEVDLDHVSVHGTLNYTLTIGNPDTNTATHDLTDAIPQYTHYLEGSTWGGLNYYPGSEELTWQGTIDAATIEVQGPTSDNFVSLSSYPWIQPVDFPSNPDEGGWVLSGFDFWYLGKHYTEAIWSVNGTLEAGSESGYASSYNNLEMPDPTIPNNLLAPWWGDIDFNDGGTWYLGTLTDLIYLYDILEWKSAPKYGTNGRQTATFQIWIRRGTDKIWFEYDSIHWRWTTATIGAEDATGTSGDMMYYNNSGDKPAEDEALDIVYTPPDPITMGFSVQVDGPPGVLIINEALMTDQSSNVYVSRAITQVNPWIKVFIPLVLREFTSPP